ncbi:MAG: UvrD-helicase domain-containing protein [Calditrichaceae bacterium]
MPELTIAQQKALVLDKNVSVTAGAGSGKTKILVDRYLKIVMLDPRKVRKVLAITFTDKAAGEMQERIADEVNRKLADTKNPDERKKLLMIRDQLNSAFISTIHGFCSRLLREFPLEAGLVPDFSVMDEIKQSVLINDAIKQIFEKIDSSKEKSEIEKWAKLFIELPGKSIVDMLREALGKPWEMNRIIENYRDRNEEEHIKFLENSWLELFSQSLGNPNIDEFVQISDQIVALDSVADKNKAGNDILDTMNSLRGNYRRNTDDLQTRAAFLRLIRQSTTGKGIAYKNLAYLGTNNGWSPPARPLVKQLSDMSEIHAQNIQTVDPGEPPNETDRKWFRLLKIFIDLFELVRMQYVEMKEDQGCVDFEDLQSLSLKLLTENKTVLTEFQSRFEYIMVDEFQDTNELQWQIVTALGNKGSGLEKVFVVGDPKQSIYGFRNADIRVFRHVKNVFAEKAGYKSEAEYDGNVIFTESFRFLPRLNAFINHLFRDILREDPENPFEVDYNPLTSKRDLPGKGWAELAILDSTDPGSPGEAEYIAWKIRNLIDGSMPCYKWDKEEKELPLEYGDIAILLKNRNRLLKVEEALRRKGIPFKTIGGIGFWQRQEIFDFYHLLRFISNPMDDFALIALLRSRLFLIPDSALYLLAREEGNTYLEKLSAEFNQTGYSEVDIEQLRDAAALALKWIECRDRMSLFDLLNMIIDDVRLKAVLSAELDGEQLSANLEKVINLANAFDSGGLGGFQDFMSSVEDLIDREIKEAEAQVTLEDRGTVKIMTIHASKGLQFPVVFAPYLNQEQKNRRSSMLIDTNLGFSAKLRSSGDGKDSQDHLLHRLIKIREHRKQTAELKRLFYVAVTRSSNYLFLSSAVKKEKIEADSPLSWIFSRFGLDLPSINEIEKIETEEFIVPIVTGFDDTGTPESDYESFYKGLGRLTQIAIGDEKHTEITPEYLVALEGEVRGRTFSATQIMTYLKDKDEYFRRYHLGFFEGDYETFADDVRKTDHALLKGKMVHRYLELMNEDTTPEEKIIDQILFEFDIFETTLREEFRLELENLSRDILQSPVGREIIRAVDAKNEISVTMKIGDDYFTGTLDRIYRIESGEWQVVDYKTNRITEAQIESEGRKYEWQIKSYALLLSRLFPDQGQYGISLYFIKPDRLYQRTFSAAEVLEIEDFFEEKIGEIKDAFPVHLS